MEAKAVRIGGPEAALALVRTPPGFEVVGGSIALRPGMQLGELVRWVGLLAKKEPGLSVEVKAAGRSHFITGLHWDESTGTVTFYTREATQ